MRRFLTIGLIALLLPAIAAGAAEEGWFGIGVEAKGEGRFWNPLISAIIVNSIDAGSPAAATPIAIGDRIVEVAGVEVSGKRMRVLVPHFEKGVGESLRLTLLNADGERYSVTLVGEKRPPNSD